MHDYLEAARTVISLESGLGRTFGDQAHRIRPALYRRRRVSCIVQLAGRGLECPLEHCAHLGIQTSAHDIAAVLVDVHREMTRSVTIALLLRFLEPIHTAPCAHQLLDVRGRCVMRQLQQLRLVLWCSDSRQSAHLGIRQFSSPHCIRKKWKRLQRARYANLRARGAEINARAPGKPVRTAPQSATPSFASVEFVEPHEQAERGGVQMRCHFGDLIAKLLEVGGLRCHANPLAFQDRC